MARPLRAFFRTTARAGRQPWSIARTRPPAGETAHVASATAGACAGRCPCRTTAAESDDKRGTLTARPGPFAPLRGYSGTTARRISSSTARRAALSSSVYARSFATSARTRSSCSKYQASIHVSLCHTWRSLRSSVENWAACARPLNPLPLCSRRASSSAYRGNGSIIRGTMSVEEVLHAERPLVLGQRIRRLQSERQMTIHRRVPGKGLQLHEQ